MKKLILLFTFFGLLGSPIIAQVHINEFSAANLHEFLDNYNRTEDWIELYNAGDEPVDLSGYHLSDKELKPGKWDIPDGTIIPANGHLVFWCSGRDEELDGSYHTNFKLAQTKEDEVIMFTDPDENVIEMFPLVLRLVENSACRTEDGAETWAVCTNPTPGSSNNGSTQFAAYTETPSMDVEAGFYTDSVVVSIINNEPNSVLRYTLDGFNVTDDSPEYEGPITVTETTVIKAQSFSNDPTIIPGKMDFNTYFINEDFSLVVFSVASDQVQDLANGNGDLIPIGSLEYFNLDKEREATTFGSLNRHGQDSWILDHRSIDWVSRDEMGYSKAVNAKLFGYSDRDEYQKFMFRNSGDDNYPANDDEDHVGSTHIRDEYVQALAQQGNLKLDQRAVERVIVFLNGDYWGVYGMRERPVDHDYTDEYYDQGKYNLQFLTTWGTTEAQYGGIGAFNDWTDFREFVLENDMSDPDNYEAVKDQFQVLSLIDYMIVNLNSVASDWMNYNTGWWRGTDPEGDHKKWGYILWDLDATFDYYINYSGVPNTDPDAQPCDIDDISDYMDQFFSWSWGGGNDTITTPADCQSIQIGASPYPADDPYFQMVIDNNNNCCENGWQYNCQLAYDFFSGAPGAPQWSVRGNIGKHEKIFKKLQDENEEFRQLYYSRQADLQNTVYTCENMINTLDSMIAVIAPEMPRQIERWGGTMEEWEQNVVELREFILARCELFDDGMVDCFELTGPFEMTLMVEPAGVGEIELNTIDVTEFPWTGAYYGGMENQIKAKANDDNFEFSHWETTAGNAIFPDSLERKATIMLESQDTVIAVFTQIVGIKDISKAINLSVYPNPATDKVMIDYELEEAMEVNISLYSLMGKQMNVSDAFSSKKSAGQHSHTITIDEQLPPGIYFVKLSAGGYQVTKKITII
jgi:hypothetical protein